MNKKIKLGHPALFIALILLGALSPVVYGFLFKYVLPTYIVLFEKYGVQAPQLIKNLYALRKIFPFFAVTGWIIIIISCFSRNEEKITKTAAWVTCAISVICAVIIICFAQTFIIARNML